MPVSSVELSTAAPAIRGPIAATASPMPSMLLTSAKSHRKVNDRVHDRKVEELTEWIRKNKFALPVHQPSDGEIIRTDPKNVRRAVGLPIIKDAVTGESYLVSHDLIFRTAGEFVPRYGWMSLPLAASIDGSLFIWPFSNTSDGLESMQTATEEASDGWGRIGVDKNSNMRFVKVRQRTFREPIWPNLNQWEIADMFFGLRIIESLDHPVHRRMIDSPDINHAASFELN